MYDTMYFGFDHIFIKSQWNLLKVVFESPVAWTEKTSNRTGPNHGPVHVTASAAPVADQSGCQLHNFSDNYKPVF